MQSVGRNQIRITYESIFLHLEYLGGDRLGRIILQPWTHLVLIRTVVRHGLRGLSGNQKGSGGLAMWKYREPRPEDYDTQEEYEEALAAYESALYDYCEEYLERD